MPPQRILVLHNRYREPGGEDHAFAQETALLRARGHTVLEYTESNEDLDESQPLTAAADAVWSRRTRARLAAVLTDFSPDLAHFHNTFARISPSAYSLCRRRGVPVVQTLHNFRLGCLNACCSRDGHPCQQCVAAPVAWPGILHGCYHGSHLASAAVAAIGVVHRSLGTYRREVDAYISTSEFARRIHLRAGVPAARSHLKPNFAEPAAPNPGPGSGGAFYAGRLTRDKGLFVLLDVWRRWRPALPLRIAGDGPDAAALAEAAHGLEGVELLGPLSREEVQRRMAEATVFIQPSLLLENCSLAVIEALSAGLPVLASGHGSFAELIEHGRSGFLFPTGDADAIAAHLGWIAAHPADWHRMRRAARARYDAHFSPEASYRRLLTIYEAAADCFAATRGAS